jgi:PPOX class probable F420-dependent enzyme
MRLGDEEARRRFADARSVRLATVSASGQPHLVPVTFAVDQDIIYTAIDAKPKSTRLLRRLSNIRANPEVCLLADHYADDWSQLWWARADGTAAVVSDPAEMAVPVGLLTARYPQYEASPPSGPVIAVRVSRWQGWSAS